jgi:Asp-tRNA(Asn)/Glu-tRNA(Gln) amidotransferase A subunit family amidase
LPYPYHTNFTDADKKIIDQPIEELVRDTQESSTSPLTVLQAYGKVAVKAQERTNCITELLLPEAESWLESDINLKGPLAGIPVSLKDSVQVKGFDTTLGYSALANQPFKEDGPMTRLLKDAGMLSSLHRGALYSNHAYRSCPVCKDCSAHHPSVL